MAGSLKRFILEGVRDVGCPVGSGAYGQVLEYEFRGLKCAGKKLHRVLYEHASPTQRADMLRRFEEECELLSTLHHPNIVQFLGVHMAEFPVLVMEYLPTNLASCLDRHHAHIPINANYSILRDVALGLRYLHEHSPPIIHRDLSANNVLLTVSLSAKISDLGVAKILDLTPAQVSQMNGRMSTQAPGIPCYMPPEVLISVPNYTDKIDSYSFGVMILHVLCGRWPFPTDLFRHDPRSPESIVPVSEIDRRAEFVREIGTDHPLAGLVRQCLSNIPAERPTAANILQQIDTAVSRLPISTETGIELLPQCSTSNLPGGRDRVDGQEQVVAAQSDPPLDAAVLASKDQEIERLESENAGLISEVVRLRDEIEEVRSDNYWLESETQALREKSRNQVAMAHTDVTENLVSLFHPYATVHWRKCANAPAKTAGAKAVMVGEKVYMEGRRLTPEEDDHQMFEYNWKEDTWTTLPQRCPTRWGGMAQFKGALITVGGRDLQDSLSGKVHSLTEDSQWEETLKPMLTSRCDASVATTSDAIVAAGGNTGMTGGITDVVEVYCSKSSEWHTAAPLPARCTKMSLVTVSDTFFLLGGVNRYFDEQNVCFSASLSSLVQPRAFVTRLLGIGTGSVWRDHIHTPFKKSAAGSLGGSLVTVGGKDDTTFNKRSSAVYAFSPHSNSWEQVTSGSLPAPRSESTTVSISANSLLVIGGFDNHGEQTNSVHMGTLLTET